MTRISHRFLIIICLVFILSTVACSSLVMTNDEILHALATPDDYPTELLP